MLADGEGGATRTLTRVVEAGSGFASQRMFPVHFGLGQAAVAKIRVIWPNGSVQEFSADELEALGGTSQALYLREGGELEKRLPKHLTLLGTTPGRLDAAIQ